jgi:hypothetical protein
VKRIPWGSIALLTLFASSGSAGAGDLGPVNPQKMPDWLREWVWAYRLPVLRALSPEEAERRMHVPDDAERRVVRYREAILPNPLNGRELVDRVLAEEAPGQPVVAAALTTAGLRRVFSRRRLAAPNFVVPVARGI